MAKPTATVSGLQPYPAYKPSGVEWLGDVPAHWEEGRLGNSVQGCIAGIWGNDPNGRDDLICVRVADFDRTRLRIRLTRPTLRAITHSERRQRLLTRGDLLLEKSGGGDVQPVGAVMLYDHDDMAVCSNFVARMPVSPWCNAKFLVYLHAHLYAIRLTVRSIKQTTGIQNLSSNSYLSETVAYPPIAEQAAIARYLDHADHRIRCCIQAKEKLVELLEEQRQALVNEAVTGRVDVRTGQPYPAYKPSGVEWLGEVPACWDVRQLGRMGTLSKGNGGSKADEARAGVPCVRYGDLYTTHTRFIRSSRGYVSKARSADYTPLKRGDVLFAASGETIDEIGKSAVNLISSGACCGGDIIVFRPKYRTHAPFMGYVSDCWSSAIQKATMGRGFTVVHIYATQLKQLVLPVPPLSEQVAIARYLDHTDRRMRRHIESAQRQIHLLNEYRTRLIADVVTGKLDVREAVSGLANDLGEPEVITGSDTSAVTSSERARNLNAVTQASEV